MDPEIEIKITTRGLTASTGAGQSGTDRTGAPVPDREEGKAGAVSGGAPSPEGAGAAGMSAGSAPTPHSAGGADAARATGGLPEPVRLDRIGQLGSSETGEGVPTPEDE